MAPPRNSAGLSEVRASPRGKSPAANSDGEMGDPAELKSRAFIRLVKQRGNRGFPAARRVVSDDSAHGFHMLYPLLAGNDTGHLQFSGFAFGKEMCIRDSKWRILPDVPMPYSVWFKAKKVLIWKSITEWL